MMSELVNHLWQSTLFVGAAWLLTLALRKNRAHVRYWVWFTASVKFLVPFSFLVGLGALMPGQVAVPAAQTEWVTVMEQIGQPLTLPAAAARAAITADAGNENYLALTALVLWTCGFAAVAIGWLVRWRRVLALRRSATRVSIPAAVPVMSSPGLLEPGVVGIFHPVLLLPQGIGERLSAAQLDAILAHELCHVRRKDNLTAAIHMAVQAIFWFHPLVWWLGARLVDERERACDEEVVRLGSQPQVYAEGILNVCKLYVESPMACVSGVTGSNLRRRIEEILRNRRTLELNFVRRATLAAAGIAAIAVPTMIGLLKLPELHAQSPRVPRPQFEVVSIKPNRSGDVRSTVNAAPERGSYTAENHSVRQLIRQAYSLKDFQLKSGPGWIDDMSTEHYDIAAKAAGSVTKEQLMLMLQVMLEDRFKLTFHYETQQRGVYRLVLAEKGVLGPMLRPPAPNDIQRSPVRGPLSDMIGQNATMQDLAAYLSGFDDRLVLDETGLSERYDFTLESAMGPNDPRRQLAALKLKLDLPPDSRPSLADALREQLGLKLESGRGPVQFMVIDRVERPTEN